MQSQKHLFSLDPEIHYLNCAYKAPMLKSGEAAVQKSLIRERNPTLISEADFFTEAEHVRELFGNIVNCEADQVAILPSTSYGFASALANVNGKPEGNAITVKDEFPSGYFALERWAKNWKQELRVIAPDSNLALVGEDWNAKILAAIDAQTSVVLLSSIHWMTGLRFNLKEIGAKCKAVGAKLIVDGTQSVGALEMDLKELNIDALICASYKWLFGTYSIALGYFGDAFANGVPLEESWMNRTNAFHFAELANYAAEYRPSSTRYCVGESSNLLTMPVLEDALRQIQEWTVAGIRSYCHNLIQPLLQYLASIGLELEPQKYFCDHLFALRLGERFDRDRLKAVLAEHKLFLSMRGDYLRVAVNVFNDAADIAVLIKCLKLAE